MVLKYYYDLLSQPCRALYIFMKQAKIPFESNLVALRKGEHFTEEFEKVNPLKKVPVIFHNNFRLTESVAIARYLTREFTVPDHWYPKESAQQAKVDEFLEWQHITLRSYGSMIFIHQVINPLMRQQPADEKKIAYFKGEFNNVLDSMEKMFLSDTKFINMNDISIADLFAACEIEQPMITGLDVFKDRPKLQEWMNRVQQRVEPDYKDAHVYCRRLKETVTGKASKL